MSSERDLYWSEYYKKVAEKRPPWLDYSNARVQAETFGLCIEAAGPVENCRCFDAGCSWGQRSSCCLHALQAREVVGIDVIEELIVANSKTYPKMKWHRENVQDRSFDQRLAPYGVSAWSTEPIWDTPPNRLQLVIEKAK